MRTPRRHHVGTVGGGGGRRGPSPSLRAIRVREHQGDEWGHDPHRVYRSPSAPMHEHLHRLSPELVNRRRREYGSTSSSSRGLNHDQPVHINAAQTRANHSLDDGDGGARGCYNNLAREYRIQDDGYVDLARPVRIKEFYPMVDGGIVPMSSTSGLDEKEMMVPKPPRYLEDGLARKEIMVPKLPRYLEDGRAGKEFMVSKPARYLEDGRGGKEIIIPRPPRYLEDGRGGKEIMGPRPTYLEDAPAHGFLSQPMNHSAGGYSFDPPLISKGISGSGNTPRGTIRGEEEQDLWYHRRLGDGYDGDDKEKIYSRDASYLGLPPLQLRAISGIPSRLPEDDNMVDLYRDSLHLPAKDFYNTNVACSLNDDHFRHKEHGQIQSLHSVKKQVVSPLIREDGQNEGYSEFRKSESSFFPTSDDIYSRMPWESQDEYKGTLNSSHANPQGGHGDELEASSRTMKKAYLLDHQSFIENDVSAYHHATEVSGKYPLGREPVEYRSRLTKGYDLSHVETEFDYEGDDNLLENYKGGSRSSLMTNQFEDIYREDASPPRRIVNIQNMDMYHVPDNRVLRRRYAVDDGVDEVDRKNFYLKMRRGHATELDRSDEQRTSEDRSYQVSFKRHGGGRPQHKIFSCRVSGPNNQFFHRSSSRFYEDQPVVNLKRRLRQEPLKVVDNFPFKRKQDSYNHHGYWKKSQHGQYNVRNAHEGDVEEFHEHVRKDPPEDSEEFKQQLHKAFLRFSKLLNEDPHQQKRYREQGKDGSLLCCVCGSLSKEFVDTHSLVMHSFYSLKVGLRTDHLGLHKALCVLMGWNWLVAPDGAKYYQSRSSSEVNATKEDLILWPPLVIIHNSSIGNKNVSAGPKIVNKEALENILRGIGVGAGKARVGLGKPANQSTMLVKFLPTFSGLQEAEKLHKYYVDNSRGRKEFQDLDFGSGSSSGAGAGGADKSVEQLLFGYLAIAEDLDKLDLETKKRCVVKSKMDIQAIADAPLTSGVATDGN